MCEVHGRDNKAAIELHYRLRDGVLHCDDSLLLRKVSDHFASHPPDSSEVLRTLKAADAIGGRWHA
ncbi:MAG: hypothetical protein JWP89_2931 [Schlesneria sp.]|nr:hypothetical protein [Schlesneria sp.]